MRTTHAIFFTLSLVLASAPATAFDAKQCERIDDVEVPYDVSIAASAVTFSSGGSQIVVNAEAITAAGRTFSGPAVGPYYADIRVFLRRADGMARVALPFGGGEGSMGSAARDMCAAIVSLAASGGAVEQAFAGFRSPVRIKFK